MKLKMIKILLLSVVFLWGSNNDITINFRNLSLNDFIKLIAKITNKNVLLTRNLTGKINFISVKPISRKQLWDILLTVLQSRGYTIIENNGYLQVVPLSEAVKLASLNNRNSIPQIATHVIYLKYITPQEAKKQVSSFLSKYGKIIIPPQGNFLIITDFPKNIRIIKKMIKKIDFEQARKIKFIKLKNMDANIVLRKVKLILSNLIPNNQYNLYANEDANEIIIIAPKKYMTIIQNLIYKFDIPKRKIITSIVTLKNTDVTELSKILDSIIKEKFTKNRPSITSDKENNALILVGNREQISILKTIIHALDVPKQQVYVKVRILELSNTKVANIGAKLGIIGGSATNAGLYTFSANLGGPALAFDPASVGLSLPTIKQGLALGATFDLLETLGAAKKLSEPSILCVNNLPSEIYVGKTVSVITQSTVGASSTDLTKNTYSRQDIGLKMKIRPRIDSDNKVAIKINGVIEDILPGSQIGLPITSKREIDTTAIVKNGQSIIIGGLIRDNSDITINKVPFFGDIPVIGALFRERNINKDKTTIVIMLTPYIVKNTDQLTKLKKLLVKLNTLEAKFVKKIIKKDKLLK